MEEYFTYMVRCRDGSLYTGFTTSVEARIAAHNAGDGAKYTRSRRPVRLVWQRKAETAREARRWEYHIKKSLTAKEKRILVEGAEADPSQYERVMQKLATLMPDT